MAGQTAEQAPLPAVTAQTLAMHPEGRIARHIHMTAPAQPLRLGPIDTLTAAAREAVALAGVMAVETPQATGTMAQRERLVGILQAPGLEIQLLFGIVAIAAGKLGALGQAGIGADEAMRRRLAAPVAHPGGAGVDHLRVRAQRATPLRGLGR